MNCSTRTFWKWNRSAKGGKTVEFPYRLLPLHFPWIASKTSLISKASTSWDCFWGMYKGYTENWKLIRLKNSVYVVIYGLYAWVSNYLIPLGLSRNYLRLPFSASVFSSSNLSAQIDRQKNQEARNLNTLAAKFLMIQEQFLCSWFFESRFLIIDCTNRFRQWKTLVCMIFCSEDRLRINPICSSFALNCFWLQSAPSSSHLVFSCKCFDSEKQPDRWSFSNSRAMLAERFILTMRRLLIDNRNSRGELLALWSESSE